MEKVKVRRLLAKTWQSGRGKLGVAQTVPNGGKSPGGVGGGREGQGKDDFRPKMARVAGNC